MDGWEIVLKGPWGAHRSVSRTKVEMATVAVRIGERKTIYIYHMSEDNFSELLSARITAVSPSSFASWTNL